MILINRDMPKSCMYCPLCRHYPNNGNTWCADKNRLIATNWSKDPLNTKPEWCGLKEVPDTNVGDTIGRLVVDKLPSAQPEWQWISCSERLPGEETPVLVTRKFLGTKDVPEKTYVEVAERIGSDWVSDSDEYKIARSRHTDPIAWMLLPEPYI